MLFAGFEVSNGRFTMFAITAACVAGPTSSGSWIAYGHRLLRPRRAAREARQVAAHHAAPRPRRPLVRALRPPGGVLPAACFRCAGPSSPCRPAWRGCRSGDSPWLRHARAHPGCFVLGPSASRWAATGTSGRRARTTTITPSPPPSRGIVYLVVGAGARTAGAEPDHRCLTRRADGALRSGRRWRSACCRGRPAAAGLQLRPNSRSSRRCCAGPTRSSTRSCARPSRSRCMRAGRWPC